MFENITPEKMSELMAAVQKRNYTVVVDKSGSMDERDGQPLTRWERVKETVGSIVKKCVQYDPDGISLYFFDRGFKDYYNVNDMPAIQKIFSELEPSGGTALLPVLNDVLTKWESSKKNATSEEPFLGETIIIVTDGEPMDDRTEIARRIIQATQVMDKDEDLAILFVQEGTDPSAKNFLTFLDKELEKMGAKFDAVAVHTQDTMAGLSITEVLVSAITN